MDGWHFATVPKKQSDIIRTKHKGMTKGWGSIPVTATIGKTSWKSSIFPERKSGTYLLPLKAKVRKAEGIFDGDTITLSLSI